MKNVRKITPFCNLHSISKKTAWYSSGTKCICYTYQIPSKCIISAKIEPIKFRSHLLNLSFSRPLQLIQINSTDLYVFFLARIYHARIQLRFTNMRGIQYSLYINPCVSPYRVPNLTLGTKYKYTNEHLNGILNVPKHDNKHDLIHFVTIIFSFLHLYTWTRLQNLKSKNYVSLSFGWYPHIMSFFHKTIFQSGTRKFQITHTHV